jgi:hypothetical protein
MSNETKAPKKYQVILSEANFAALKVISSIANGACEITIIKGEITVIKPTSQRIDLQRAEERAAIVSGHKTGSPVDMSTWLETKIEVEAILDEEAAPEAEAAK